VKVQRQHCSYQHPDHIYIRIVLHKVGGVISSTEEILRSGRREVFQAKAVLASGRTDDTRGRPLKSLYLLGEQVIGEDELIDTVLEVFFGEVEAGGLLVKLHPQPLVGGFFGINLLLEFFEFAGHKLIKLVIVAATAHHVLRLVLVRTSSRSFLSISIC